MSTSRTLVGADSVYCYQTNTGLYVESVGFDGNYAGYLNDPFPPRPECLCPDVIGLIMQTDLEGNILYKGKYYSIVYELPKYDLNHDGVIDIADVNEAINAMLGKSSAMADVNGDGMVDISDVNAVINAMLGKN